MGQDRLVSGYRGEAGFDDDAPHGHDFDQFICCLGSDPRVAGCLRAEVKSCPGKEHETHVMTAPKIARLTPGLVHRTLYRGQGTQPALHLDSRLREKCIRRPEA